jgi:hypothetical protein
MATGPEHFAEAESLLEQADEWLNGEDAPDELAHARRGEDLTAAQVHATLALAAATALSENGAMPGADFDAWAKVASADPAQRLRLSVWWLDDGHENPGAPELYFTQGAALDAGVKQFRDDNFDRQDAQLTWTLFEEENGEGSLELVADGRCTGIIVRPVQPKDAA